MTNETTDQLEVINTANNSVMTSIPVGNQPRAVVVNAAGTRAYTGNTLAPLLRISVVNLKSDTDMTDVTSGQPESAGEPWHCSERARGSLPRTSAPSADAAAVGILRPRNNSVGSVTVGRTPTSVAVDPSGTRAYVANRDSSSLSIINTASSTNVRTVPLGLPAGAPSRSRLTESVLSSRGRTRTQATLRTPSLTSSSTRSSPGPRACRRPTARPSPPPTNRYRPSG